MNSKLSIFWKLLSRYKYLITIVIGVAVIGFIDENSFRRRIQYELQIGQLKEDIKLYNERNEASTKELKTLRHTPNAIHKIARERYFMKADDEDIYVLSTDMTDAEVEMEKAKNSYEAIK